MRTNAELYTLQVKSKCYIETVNLKDKSKVNRRRQGQPTTQPSAAIAKVAWELGFRAYLDEHPSTPVPEPTPTPPPTLGKRYAPRTYNLGNRDQDPRFCCKPEYGVIFDANRGVMVDEMGVTYDKDNGFNLDGLRDRTYIVPGINAADNMNQLETCDPYISESGLHLPPYPGDPIQQTGSYHR